MLHQLISGLRFIVIVNAGILSTGVHSSPAEDRVLAKLFRGNVTYDRLSRAVDHHFDSVEVRMGIQLVKIIQIEEFNEVLRANLVQHLRWHDYRLAWNTTEYDNLKEIYVEPTHVWQPDIRLWNSAVDIKKHGDGVSLGFVRVTFDGVCSYYSPMELSVSHCDMDITWFPFDEQKCELIYESWKYESHEVNLSYIDDIANTSVITEVYQNCGEWKLVEIPVTETKILYAEALSPYSRLIFTVHVHRKYKYYVINLIFPCALFSFLTIITFFLPPESGERIGLAITVLLSLTVYQTFINEILPATSEVIPIIGIYFTFVISVSALSVTTSVIVLNVYSRGLNRTAEPLPHWAKWLICKDLARLLGMKIQCKFTADHGNHYGASNHDNHHGNSCNAPHDIKEEGYRRPGRLTNSNLKDKPDCICTTNQLLLDIKSMLAARLNADSEERDDQTKKDELTGDWMSAALVLDRLFFILSASCLVAGSAFLFLCVLIWHHQV